MRLDRDAIKATYRDGFLLITLPKRAPTEVPQARVIPINTEPTDTEDEDN